ncbi:hypothetical protein [Bradyrhizobium prioriisuperbiae]|uniref:hypothetical protein n=1 Tax=Bradyrhizobium prioriisuperbiae TaxID=2854389 RepID=UPI003CCE2015
MFAVPVVMSVGLDSRCIRMGMRVVVMIIAVVVIMPVIAMMRVVMRLMITGFMRVIAMSMIVRMIRNVLVVVSGLERLRRDRGIDSCALDDLAPHALAMAAATGAAMARAPTVGAVLGFLFSFAMSALVCLDQRLPIGDGDLVVVGMNFAEGEEAVAVATIFDEGCLQRRFNAGDLGEVDIAAKLFALGGLEIKLFDAIAADHHDPGFFRMGGIDQHLVGHMKTLGGGARVCQPAQCARRGTATVHLIRG